MVSIIQILTKLFIFIQKLNILRGFFIILAWESWNIEKIADRLKRPMKIAFILIH